MHAKRMARVAQTRCVACGACAKECPLPAISVYRGCWAQVNGEKCVGCGRCAKVCPADCITLVDREGQA